MEAMEMMPDMDTIRMRPGTVVTEGVKWRELAGTWRVQAGYFTATLTKSGPETWVVKLLSSHDVALLQWDITGRDFPTAARKAMRLVKFELNRALEDLE